VIMYKDKLVGRIGLHHMNLQNKIAAIGYWQDKGVEGQGIITKSCIALINYGFEDLGLHRIEIKAATNNLKSQAIPERLNFKKEGILRQAELVNNEYLDLVLFSMLSHEWTGN
jgi:ribosomal-protein-serine acetyltransferase